ncbi:unnamed protein product [Linum tenue]|nr:unnamed protein product [Linum tenue]
MVEMGIRPNGITFMNILSACSHSGHVDAGKFYFRLMENYSIEPNLEHFACLVDLLSRAGDVDGAYGVINSMPFPADASIWGALVNGCRIHHRMDIIQFIQRDLLDVTTDDTGYYTLLSNIYAEEGKWVEFGTVRSKMERTGLKKVPGYSTIELGNKIYRFGAGDTYHWRFNEVCSFLENFPSLARPQQGCSVFANPSNESFIFPEYHE